MKTHTAVFCFFSHCNLVSKKCVFGLWLKSTIELCNQFKFISYVDIMLLMKSRFQAWWPGAYLQNSPIKQSKPAGTVEDCLFSIVVFWEHHEHSSLARLACCSLYMLGSCNIISDIYHIFTIGICFAVQMFAHEWVNNLTRSELSLSLKHRTQTQVILCS